jgi:predicted alpha/beta superfamily hydrolase
MQPTAPQGWLTYDEYRAGQPHTVSGQLRVLPGLHSPQLGNSRDLLVYLPPGYGTMERRYPVLYMQDGQNLFDRGTGFGGEEWGVDETLNALAEEGLGAIAVGLPHAGDDRIPEYNPFGRGRGEQYLAFVVETVKPLIDAEFLTRPERDHTGLLGSSMGGLISLVGFFRHPAVFGLVGSLSPALWFAGRALYDMVADAPWVPGRLYLDNGTRENSAGRMARLLRTKGYRDDVDLCYVKEAGGAHSESAWARRLPGALRFLLRA